MSNKPPMTINRLRELLTKAMVIKHDYRAGKRSADDCIAELMAAPYHYASASLAMRFLDPGPPQEDPPPGWTPWTADY